MNKLNTVLSIALVTVLIGTAVPASAQGPEVIGPQACQPMDLDIALKGLQWRSDGIYNVASVPLWVVCSIPRGINYRQVSAANRIYNFSSQYQTIQCLYKVTDVFGGTVRSISRKKSVPPQTAWGLNADITMGDMLNYLTVSCKIPPNAGIGGIFHGSDF